MPGAIIYRLSIIILFLLLSFPAAISADSDNWQYIVSPGALNPYHAFISGIENCTKCHELMSGISVDKCLFCHGTINERIDSLKGYHGTLSKDCFSCHTGHTINIIKNFSREEFDHNRSIFPLAGGHRKPVCEKCHLRKEKKTGRDRFTFIGVSTECAGCHVNIHESGSMENCGDCHGQDEWTKTAFDHNGQTKYSLIGIHGGVPCEKCHGKDNAAEGIRNFSVPDFNNCLSCHEDRHEGVLSADCLTCHTMRGWKTLVFSHDQSAYALKGEHRNVSCGSCHAEGKYKAIKHDTCSACHQKTPHNLLHEPCTSCHSEDGWRALLAGWERDIDGHQKYNYPLKGAHLKTDCGKCHVQEEGSKYFAMQYGSCIDCHRDEHGGQFKDKSCEACHVVEDFKKLTFDHEQAEFKLEVMHKEIKCEKCHAEKQYAAIPVDCGSCHKDITAFYKGRFDRYSGEIPSPKSRLVGCRACHETNRKDFNVEGATCLTCHEKTYDDYFSVWREFIKKEVSRLDEKMTDLSNCMERSPEKQNGLMEIKEKAAFIEKNFYHNYRLSAMVIREYIEELDNAAAGGCGE